MRKSGSSSLIVAVLCMCTIAAQQPAQAAEGDILVLAVNGLTGPDAPIVALAADSTNVWAPADNMTATWESVTIMSKLSNPVQNPSARVPVRSLSLAARVDVIDVNGILGFDYTPQGTLVLDGKPNVIYSKAVPSRYCRFYWPLRYTKTMPTPGQWVSQLQPYNLTVEVPLDPNRPYPVLLGRVEWSMYALINTQAKTVDVPFSLSADWLTLTPGLEIKVEQATAESGKYQYRLATRYSHSKVVWAATGGAISLWTQDPTPEVILTKLDVLDPQGNSIRDTAGGTFSGGGSSTSGSSATGSSASGSNANASGTGSSSASGASASGSSASGSSAGGSSVGGSSVGGSSDLTTGTVSGMGSCGSCGMVTTFRFTLALKPQQQQLRFILENVPVPSF